MKSETLKNRNQKYRRGRHQCIFCGNYGSSKEHIFPDWLKRYFPRDDKTTHTSVHYFWQYDQKRDRPNENRQNKQGHTGSLKTKVVCKTCNTGWMHDLEDEAKPILTPLLQADRLNFTPELQQKISTWCVKTCMTAEQLHPRSAEISQSDRTWLMENITPPSDWFVWVGHYDGEDWWNLAFGQDRGGLDTVPVAEPDDARHKISASVIGIGHVFFLVVNTTAPNVADQLNGFELADPFRCSPFPQIWPPKKRSLIWPLYTVMGDNEAVTVANFLRTSGLFDHSLDASADWTFTIYPDS